MQPSAAEQTALQLKIELTGTSPLVWRRLLVPGHGRLATLHDYFQVAMGWTDSHLHAFEVDGMRYGMDDADSEEDLDESDFSIDQAIGAAKRFRYEYDFGDSWVHDVVVEERTAERGLKHAVCLDGANACPPEDVGGVHGFDRFKQAIADPANEDHDEYLSWIGAPYDPTAFDLASVNAVLQQVR